MGIAQVYASASAVDHLHSSSLGSSKKIRRSYSFITDEV